MPNNYKLKKMEKALLEELETNARRPFSTIGKKIRASQQHISYAVNSMFKKGIIQKFYTLIDYSKLGALKIRVYFRINYIDEQKLKELFDYLSSEPHTSGVFACGGKFDIICTFFTSNPSQFNKTLRKIMEKFPLQLQNYTVLTTIVNREFGRKYLFKNFLKFPQLILGGDRKPERLDDMDLQILNEISENARKSSVDIAQKLSVNPKTIIHRIRKMKEKEIILGFRPLLNPAKLGRYSWILMIRYHNVSSEIENKFIDYLRAHPNILSIVKTLGEWDIEIELEAAKETELRKIEMEIRQKFTKLIQRIENLTLYHIYKRNYFPKFLIEKD